MHTTDDLLQEIAKLRDIIEPTIAVITNIGYAHVEGFGPLEGVMAEKLSLLDRAPVAIIGSGPDMMWPEARRRTQVIPAALPGKSADDSLLDRYLDSDGRPRLTLHSGEHVTLPALGIHQLENAQIALAVAQRAGVEHDAAVRALAGQALTAGGGSVQSWRAALAATLAVTLFNPQVYLETVVLLGAIGAVQPSPLGFFIGAAMASFGWFFGLAAAAGWLAPRLASPRVWRAIDLAIGIILAWVAWRLASGAMMP